MQTEGRHRIWGSPIAAMASSASPGAAWLERSVWGLLEAGAWARMGPGNRNCCYDSLLGCVRAGEAA